MPLAQAALVSRRIYTKLPLKKYGAIGTVERKVALI
jgi:hypothetical protein